MFDPRRWFLRVAEDRWPEGPHSITMKDDRPFAFAGLWEGWKAPGSDDWLKTCTIITTEANELLAQIHNRMPVILPEELHAAWSGDIR